MIQVKIKKFNDEAKIPEKAYDKDFCYDVYATSEKEVAPGIWRYGLGFGLQLNEPHGKDYPVCFHLYPRSSIWKTGMVLANSVGTIDEGYTNEICAVFYHVMKDMPRYKVGDKIGQICLSESFSIDFNQVDNFEETERGLKGFGSSDKK